MPFLLLKPQKFHLLNCFFNWFFLIISISLLNFSLIPYIAFLVSMNSIFPCFSLSFLKTLLFHYLLGSSSFSFTLKSIAWRLLCFIWGIMFSSFKCPLHPCTVFVHMVGVLPLLMLQGVYTSFVYVVSLFPLWMSQGIYTVVVYLVGRLQLEFYRVFYWICVSGGQVATINIISKGVYTVFVQLLDQLSLWILQGV